MSPATTRLAFSGCARNLRRAASFSAVRCRNCATPSPTLWARTFRRTGRAARSRAFGTRSRPEDIPTSARRKSVTSAAVARAYQDVPGHRLGDLSAGRENLEFPQVGRLLVRLARRERRVLK